MGLKSCEAVGTPDWEKQKLEIKGGEARAACQPGAPGPLHFISVTVSRPALPAVEPLTGVRQKPGKLPAVNLHFSVTSLML